MSDEELDRMVRQLEKIDIDWSQQARRDIPAIVAEVRRLQRLLKTEETMCDEWEKVAQDMGRERDTALAEVVRLQSENRCLQDCLQLQQEETERAGAEVERLEEHNASCAKWMAEMEAANKRLREGKG